MMASAQGMTRALVVTWLAPDLPNSPSVSYVVRYRAASSSGEEIAGMTGDLAFTITGLSPFTNYSVTVQACSEVGCGTDSEAVTALTIEEGMIVMLSRKGHPTKKCSNCVFFL